MKAIITALTALFIFITSFATGQAPPPSYASTVGLEGYWRFKDDLTNYPADQSFIEVDSSAPVSFGIDKDDNPSEALIVEPNTSILRSGIMEDKPAGDISNFLPSGNKISMQVMVNIDNSVATTSNLRSYIMGRNNNIAPFHSYTLMVEYTTIPAQITFVVSTNGTGDDASLSFPLAAEDFNNWVSLAAVYDGSEMRLYKNEQLMNSRSAFGDIRNGPFSRPLFIGGSDINGLMFKGQIDEAYLYSRALTESEIRQLNRVNTFIHEDVPITIVNQSQSGKVCVGSSTTKLFVQVNRTDPSVASYQWKKGGVDLTNNMKYQGVNSPNLDILDFQSSDFGIYTCEVSEGTDVLLTDPIELTEIDGSIVDDNLIHHYTFYKGSLEDNVGTNNISQVNNMKLTSNRVGLDDAAYTQNSSSSQTFMALTAPVENNVTTVSFWMNTKSTPTSVQRYPLRSGTSDIIWISTPGEILLLNTSNGHTNTNYTLTNQWNHIVYAVDNNSSDLYINGEKVFSMSNAQSFNTNPLTRLFQTQNGNAPDEYADVRIYNEFLTEDKVYLIYNLSEFKSYLPEELSICEGGDASITVQVSDNTNFFQWFKNGTPLTDGAEYTGTQTAQLIISNVNSASAGNYSVDISNGCHVITSTPVNVLTITGVGNDPTDGLVSYFPLDAPDIRVNRAGTDQIVTAGINANQLDRFNNPQRAAALFERFHGIELANPITSNQSTVSFWVQNSNILTFKVLIGSNNQDWNHLTLSDNNQVYYASTSTNYVPTGVYLPENVWTHVTLVRDGNNAKYYFNGELVIDASDAVLYSTRPLRVVGNLHNLGLNLGAQSPIDELRIYDRPLDAAEVKNLAQLAQFFHDDYVSAINECEGQEVNLSYTFNEVPSTVQWLKDGLPVNNSATVSGTTTRNLTITSLSANEAGNYQLQIFNGCAENRSPITTVEIGSSDLSITDQPTSLVSCEGQTISLSATINGTPTSMQWFKDGSPITNGGDISGATTASLTINNATSADNGNYYLEITGGSCGLLTSAEATVTINTAPSTPVNETAPSALTICEGTATLLSVEEPGDGSTANWYSSSTSTTPITTGNEFNTPVLSANTTYYVERRSGDCASTRIAINVDVIAAPAAPTTTDQFFCGTATVADLSATGTNIQWYENTTGGLALAASTALVDGQTYYASQTDSGCESPTRTAALVSVGAIPASPTGDPTQSFCSADNPTIADLSATGTNIRWYLLETGGQIQTNAIALASGTYYAAQLVGNCESDNRLEVEVHVITTPSAPTGAAVQAFCTAATIGDLVASGTDVSWYDNASGGAALALSTALVDGGIYYAEQVEQGLCSSLTRLAVEVSIGIPDAPSADANQFFCGSATVADLQATGANILWYADETGGAALDPSTALVNGESYYATQNAGACESPTRTEVAVHINVVPDVPTGNTTPAFCSADNPTIADLIVSGNGIIWFDAPVGGNELNSSSLLNSGTYYAASIENGCESLTRLEVAVTVNASPSAPTGDSFQAFCSAASIDDLVTNEAGVVWFDAATGGVSLDPSTNLVDGTTYYAEQTINNCPSIARLAVEVAVGTPNTPSADVNQFFCGTPTVADLEANGTIILWYNSATGGSALPSTTLLVDGTSYFAAQSNGQCESTLRTEVTVEVNPIPPTPTAPAQEFCSVDNPTVNDLEISSPGSNIRWYNVSTGGMQLASNTPLSSGTYYVAQFVDGCESGRSAANILVITLDISVTKNENVLTANNANASYQWVDCDDNNAPITGATDQSYTATANGNYAVEITENGCTETSDCIAVSTVGLNENELAGKIKLYPNPTNNIVTIDGLEYFSSVVIYDALGKVINTYNTTSKVNLTINVNTYETGVYLVKISNDKTSVTKRLMVTK